MHIFISYAKKDTRDLAFKLRDALAALPGVTAWMDESLEAGESWAWQIQQEIDRCDYVVVLLSPDVNRTTAPRSFVLNEIDYAQQENKHIIPVMALKTKVPVQIAGIQYIDFVGDHATGLDRLISTIARLAGIVVLPPPVEPPLGPSDSSHDPIPFSPVPTQQPSDARLPAIRRLRLTRRLLITLVLVALAVMAGLFILPGIITPDTVANQPPPDVLSALEALVTRQPEIFALTATASSPTPSATFTPGPTPTPTEYTTAALDAALTATAEALPGYPGGPPITANNQWSHVMQSVDGVDMVLVPVGCFIMGSEDGDSNEQPVTRQCIERSFWIDRTEVSNVEFVRLNGESEYISNWSDPQRPREQITWFEARNFCFKRGARLPTELEWEYAARGPDNLVYPSGNTFVPDNLTFEDNANQTVDVGSRPGGASWVGALDMSGNVWEWISTIYGIDTGDYDFADGGERLFGYPYDPNDGREQYSLDGTLFRAVRGGPWNGTSDVARAASRYRLTPSERSSNLGFRCARSY